MCNVLIVQLKVVVDHALITDIVVSNSVNDCNHFAQTEGSHLMPAFLLAFFSSPASPCQRPATHCAVVFATVERHACPKKLNRTLLIVDCRCWNSRTGPVCNAETVERIAFGGVDSNDDWFK